MSATTLIIPEKTNDAEGYEEPINVVTDGLAAGGFYPQTASPGDLAAGLERDGGGNIVLKDALAGSATLTQILAASSLPTHRAIDQLVHDIAESAYREITRSSGQITTVIIWTSAAKITKIREVLITRSSGQVSVVVEKQYNAAGTLVETLTTTFTRSGGQIANDTAVLT